MKILFIDQEMDLLRINPTAATIIAATTVTVYYYYYCHYFNSTTFITFSFIVNTKLHTYNCYYKLI